MGYADVGRKLVLGLKHGDRADIARAAGPWMARAGADLLRDDPDPCSGSPAPVAPCPGATTSPRNLALSMAAETGSDVAVRALVRLRATPTQDGRDRDARFRNLSDAIAPHPRYGRGAEGPRGRPRR
jgi:predicted amidophosphoribosyltransferase